MRFWRSNIPRESRASIIVRNPNTNSSTFKYAYKTPFLFPPTIRWTYKCGQSMAFTILSVAVSTDPECLPAFFNVDCPSNSDSSSSHSLSSRLEAFRISFISLRIVSGVAGPLHGSLELDSLSPCRFSSASKVFLVFHCFCLGIFASYISPFHPFSLAPSWALGARWPLVPRPVWILGCLYSGNVILWASGAPTHRFCTYMF